MSADNLKIISQGFSWQQHGHFNSLSEQFREYSVNAIQRISICINVKREKEKKNAKECNLVLPN